MREKLIELLDETFEKQYDKNLVITAYSTANHLIANGVTIQQWVPVTERLPEIYRPVLIKYLSAQDRTASPDFVDTAVMMPGDIWYWWEGDVGDCDISVSCIITHWMPLPEPPAIDK